ncbi:NEAT domain-containing protein [Cohnella faecalis]|uniref:NEAT domain-containing protein n=1 Tax=Cohnella faecalis TaxID=2315694 RepID=UPI001314FCEC|nr:NEAT domain-containing protein [Cohnella faecalis]
MKYRLAVRSLLAALGIWLSIGSSLVFAETALADGKYTADYLVLKAEDDSVSMANDYWEKPATVVVSGGTAKVQLKINHSKWVTEFKVPGNGGYVDTKVVVVNKREDKRVVEFSANVTEPIVAKIHVTVPDIDYDHDYTIRLVFDSSSFKLVSSAEKNNGAAPTKEPASTPAATGKTEPANAKAEQPTGSEAPKPASEPQEAASSTQKPETATKASATAKADAASAGEKSSESVANAEEASTESSLASERPTDQAPSTEELKENDSEAASPSASASGEALSSDEDDRQTAASGDGEANQAAALTGTDAPKEASNSRIQWWIAGAVILLLAGAALYVQRGKNRKPQA